MNYKPLPATVTDLIMTLLSWLDWIVLLLCIARLIWVGAQLLMRLYRDEAIEGAIGSGLAAFLLGAASAIAAAVLPTP
ncbi:hypothetical protein ABIA39_007549 [Nocardia sp. GAS34]|uniref:hypothetical protein n=1 Tax=unclassified Nocardia TaxID=2637762 RepID=UPI003D207CD5